jgi:NDP-sugar pyrophosphorylase family protein
MKVIILAAGKAVQYVDQIEMRGTLGALFSAKPFINPGERFLILNGDDIHNQAELGKYLAYNRSFGLFYAVESSGYHKPCSRKKTLTPSKG